MSEAVFNMTFSESSNFDISFEETGTFDMSFDVGQSLDPYTGTYTVTPKAFQATVLATKNKSMTDNVTVIKIPYYETSNPQEGLTAYIADEL